MKKIITITYAMFFTLYTTAQILIIPDVHGRAFWRETVDRHPSLPVVFLGDYLDPYARENITPEEALANFKDIIAFKQANKDRVTLLIAIMRFTILIHSIGSAGKTRFMPTTFISYSLSICPCSQWLHKRR